MKGYIIVKEDKVFNGFIYIGLGKMEGVWVSIDSIPARPFQCMIVPSWSEAELMVKQYGGQMVPVEIAL